MTTPTGVTTPAGTTSSGAAPVVAVVPVRDGDSGKSRLAARLAPAQRRRLVARLARHVVATLAASPQVGRIVVVTPAPAFVTETLAGLALPGAPLDVLAQPGERPGLNAALDLARDHVRAQAPGTLLLVAHADLPALTPGDVGAMLAAALAKDAGTPATGCTGSRAARCTSRPGPGPARTTPARVAIATDRHGTGTNLLVLPADADYAFRFGIGSRAAHQAEAERHGLGAVVMQRPGTAADLDTCDDWDALPAPTRVRLAG